MTENSARRRNSLTTQEREEIRERTDRTGQGAIDEERRQREAKTARLRAARLQAEQRAKQL
jgi:hypothetical protein